MDSEDADFTVKATHLGFPDAAMGIGPGPVFAGTFALWWAIADWRNLLLCGSDGICFLLRFGSDGYRLTDLHWGA